MHQHSNLLPGRVHNEVEVVQQLRADFVSNTLTLGEAYLHDRGGCEENLAVIIRVSCSCEFSI